MRKFVFLFSIFLLFTVNRAYSQIAVPSDLNLFVNKVMQENKLPGIALAIVKDDAVVYAKGYGVRTPGKSELVDEHTLFQAASITKSFTATLLGILVDRGKLKWTDPVIKYLPEFETSEPFVTQQLTIQDLFTLRSGIIGGDTLKGKVRTDLIPQIKNLKISNSFRVTQTSYNLSYTLAGLIAETVEGKSWEELIRKELLEPLKMKESFTDIHSAVSSSMNVSTPNYFEEGKIISTKWDAGGIYGPAEALITNVVDLAKYIRLYLKKGTFENNLLIKPETLDKMQTPQMIPASFAKEYFNPKANIMTMGLGWFISDYRGLKVIQMAGLSSGDTNLITLIPEKNIGIVIQTNMAGAFDAFAPINYKIIDELLSK